MRKSRSNPISAITVVSLLALLSSGVAMAAPCCGGGSGIPALITGDDGAQLGASLSQASVIGDAPAEGMPVFRSTNDSEVTQAFRLDGAYRISDRFQAGAVVPLIRRARQLTAATAQAYGFGDITLNAGYEALPEWSYSAWKPHGFLFLQTTLPTSPSTYDSEAPFQIDARGRGFFQLGLGAAFLKGVGNWDFIASVEGHRSFARTFAASDGGTLNLTPGWGATGLLGVGYSPRAGIVRLGLSLSPVFEGPIDVRGEVNSTSADQLVWNTSAQVGVLISPEWSSALSYTDQTLLGPTRNVSLSRSVALSAQKRWAL
ncbi:MAG: serine protease spb1 [Deltaproteobacteria bacterium]|nr:serine protease spb1 [Deltaproteobacteria bacterium]